MAEDEDPPIAAVLAKLAGQDAAAVEDARAALEWIAGDQGLVFITQQRIQNFCWYDLPVKWFNDLDDKLRVVAALAQALDLLQLPRYAAVCRSGTTREVLSAYETGLAQGKAAFRRAAAASGWRLSTRSERRISRSCCCGCSASTQAPAAARPATSRQKSPLAS